MLLDQSNKSRQGSSKKRMTSKAITWQLLQ
jgi:hypothetical protein